MENKKDIVMRLKLLLNIQKEDIPESVIKRKIAAIENLVRSETNNNFQRKELRFHAASHSGKLVSMLPYYLQEGDTVEINDSVNEGLYTVIGSGAGTVSLDRQLYDASDNMITKVVYPEDVKEGVLNLLQYTVYPGGCQGNLYGCQQAADHECGTVGGSRDSLRSQPVEKR